MVSLQPNAMSTSAQFMADGMEDASTSHNDVEPILASTDNGNFKKLRTIPFSCIHLLLSLAISFADIFLSTLWPKDKHTEAQYIMIYSRAIFWIITFLIDGRLRKHHDKLRMNGYHDFHRSITRHNGIALNTVSAWNTLLLLSISQQINTIWNNWIEFITCVLILQISETFILFIAHGIYIFTVHKFNKNAHCPDALRGANSAAGSLGLLQPGSREAELLEKQADLIAYLKDHNQKLNQKLHQMQAERDAVWE